MREKTVIFTDLDGTLLDDNYNFEEAKPGLRILNENKVPLVFCSAKTKAEQEVIRSEMGINDPFIVENGSAIYIPKGHLQKVHGEDAGQYEVVILGIRSQEIIEEIKKLREKYMIKSYYFMSDEEVSKVTGLSLKAARNAKKREFGETVVEAEKEALEELNKKFEVVSGGRFIQVFGKGSHKGEAVRILSNMYRKEYGGVKTIGIGNAENDKPMLEAVQYPHLVKNSDGNWAELDIANIQKVTGVGPKGWTQVVKIFMVNEQ